MLNNSLGLDYIFEVMSNICWKGFVFRSLNQCLKGFIQICVKQYLTSLHSPVHFVVLFSLDI